MKNIKDRAQDIRDENETVEDRYIYLFNLLDKIQRSPKAMNYREGTMELYVDDKIHAELNATLVAFMRDVKSRHIPE